MAGGEMTVCSTVEQETNASPQESRLNTIHPQSLACFTESPGG